MTPQPNDNEQPPDDTNDEEPRIDVSLGRNPKNPFQQRSMRFWQREQRKTLQPLPAQLLVEVRIFDRRNRDVQIERVSASTDNAQRDIQQMRINALINARYQYIMREGGYDNHKQTLQKGDYNRLDQELELEIIYEELDYLIGESKTYKRENINGKYYNVIRDEKGEFVAKTPWSSKRYEAERIQ